MRRHSVVVVIAIIVVHEKLTVLVEQLLRSTSLFLREVAKTVRHALQIGPTLLRHAAPELFELFHRLLLAADDLGERSFSRECKHGNRLYLYMVGASPL